MLIFEKTASEQAKIDKFIAKAEQDCQTLSEYAEYIPLETLEQVKKQFAEKTEDFYNENRKLNIAVIGQVKAGKSTFLNTLLFDGKNFLPTARTPKTATLTKIEYAEQNRITVEYYQPDEWTALENAAKNETNEAAVEIMSMVEENQVDPRPYLEKGTETITFDSSEELMERMNEYVGENGTITSFVKNVTIYLNKPELSEISIVDTPGLNDAIGSRSDKTREFLSKCDVVFFLSTTSQFLDTNDQKLLKEQFPAQGIKHLLLISSKFDSGIADVIKKQDSLLSAADHVENRMNARAKEVVSEIKGDERLAYILKQCESPLLISSMVHNLMNKNHEDYNRTDKFYYKKIAVYGEPDAELLKRISGFEKVQARFQEIISEKDSILQEKAKAFLPDAYANWKNAVKELITEAKRRKEILETEDCEQLVKKKKVVESQIHEISYSLEVVLGDLLVSLEQAKNNSMQRIREEYRELSKLEDRTGTESHVSRYKVTTGHLWWKSSHYEYSTYTTTYTYISAADALENIRNFATEASSVAESTLHHAVDIRATKQKLIRTILDNFDTSDENFDVHYFRHMVEMTLNRLEFPVMKLDFKPFINSVSASFSGEVRDANDRFKLRKLHSETMDKLFNTAESEFVGIIKMFRDSIESMKNTFETELLKNINDEFETLQKHLKNKKMELQNYAKVISILESII